MREREDGRTSGPRRAFNDDFLRDEDEPVPLASQALETLREGYSWVRALEARHPGWHPFPVEGFPFTMPGKSLVESRVCLVSLAGVYRKGQKPFSTLPGAVPPQLRAMRFRGRGDWSMREIPSGCDAAELAIAHAYYDHSEGDEDINCVFPLTRLKELEVDNFIGECAPSHYSMMGYVPEVQPLLQTTAREILPRLKKHGVDVVLVSGGCALSHQSAVLIQRAIEAAGIPTVGVTVCKDLTQRLQAPRAVALRFPMGNPFGASLDTPMQSRILRDALSLIETAKTPGDLVSLPYEWSKL